MTFEVKNLYKSFGEKKVLEDVSFCARGGSALGLLGRNGAGKTTSIRIIMGVFPPDSGNVLIDGAPISQAKLSLGYLPEEHGLYPKLPINEQLIYLAQLRGMRQKDAKASMAHWLSRLDMQQYTDKKLETLSKGNQQKIQLVAALVANPDFVILDEPFSGLDPVNAALLKEVVKELISQGKLVLFSSHQMSYVEEFCDEIAILHQGRIVLAGGIDDIKRSYDRRAIVVRSPQNSAILPFCTQQLQNYVSDAAQDGAALRVTLRRPEDKVHLMAALADNDFDIDSIGVYEPSLGDIFVQYTGDEPDTTGGDAV